jgi:hypothetical protein
MKNRWWVVIQFIMIIAAMGQLTMARGSYLPYLVLFGAGLVALGLNFFISNHNAINAIFLKKTYERNTTVIFAILMTIIVLCANYNLYVNPNGSDNPAIKALYGIIAFLSLGIGTYYATYNIFKMIACHIGRISIYGKKGKMKSWEIFIFCMFSFMVVYSLIMTMGLYPGIVNSDATDQITQTMTGVYSNHHPFYHTLIIKACMDIANIISPANNINFAVSVYSYFSIFCMALAFSLLIMTLVSVGVPRWCIAIIYAFYLLMPYHILFSFAMWKDTPFAALVLIFSLYSYRVFKGIGNSWVNYIVVLLSGTGMCIFRSNGMVAFLLYGLVLLLVYRLKAKKMVAVIAGALFLSIILKFVSLGAMGIEQPDTIEHLSIPAQQIARVITVSNDLTSSERSVLSEVVDIERVPETYVSYTSDPIKYLVRESGNQTRIRESAFIFAGTYLTIGIRHPFLYAQALIDETVGFWDSGYLEWKYYYSEVTENSLGIRQVSKVPGFDKLLNAYANMYTHIPILNLCICIGFNFWLCLVALYTAIIRKDRGAIMMSIPVLAIIATLLVSTPVYAEFRYIYSMFTCLPLILVSAFFTIRKEPSGTG